MLCQVKHDMKWSGNIRNEMFWPSFKTVKQNAKDGNPAGNNSHIVA